MTEETRKPVEAKPAEAKPEWDDVAGAWISGGLFSLAGVVLAGVPLYSLVTLAWRVASGAVRLPLDPGAVRDGVMSVVIGLFGVFMLRIGVQMLRRQSARAR